MDSATIGVLIGCGPMALAAVVILGWGLWNLSAPIRQAFKRRRKITAPPKASARTWGVFAMIR